MMIGIGIDLVKNTRIKAVLEKWDRRFLERVFSEPERVYAFSKKFPHTHLAGRFAAKEAFFKALGTGWGKGIRWNEVSVLPPEKEGQPGPPRLVLSKQAQKAVRKQGVEQIRVSLSHEGDFSIAQVLLLGKDISG